MAETNATILIPDISGFTEFMTTTELNHASHAINILIDSIVNAVGDEYEVSEIEGDAVLLIKQGEAPSKKEIVDTCFKIFNSFHFQRRWMEQYTVCPCGACMAIINLTLKFVVHHGPLAEIRVGNFVKHSGTEMIVAHRLLKNSIDNHEYLLMTEKLLQQIDDSHEPGSLHWNSAFDEYSSLGKVEYRYALLDEVRRNAPQPPPPENNYRTDDTSYLEIRVDAHYMDVYMAMMNIPGRPEWMPGLNKVEQEMPEVFVGSIHHCSFEDYEATVSPLRMSLSDEGIIYAESCTIKELDLSVVHEFVFKKSGDNSCLFAARFLNASEEPIPAEVQTRLYDRMEMMAKSLKEYCEKVKEKVE